MGLSKNMFNEFWENTRILRSYQGRLPVEEVQAPYLFVCESPESTNSVVVARGVMVFYQPRLIIPRIEKDLGFEDDNESEDLPFLIYQRVGQIPPSLVLVHEKEKEARHSGLDYILNELCERLDKYQDRQTGLITGHFKGRAISLMRYAFELLRESSPRDIGEAFSYRDTQPRRLDRAIQSQN